MKTTREMCAELGDLLEEKSAAYGDSIGTVTSVMRLLYPRGLSPEQMGDALVMTRLLDKLARIANRGADGKDRGGESPWMDAAGYCVRAWERDEMREAVAEKDAKPASKDGAPVAAPPRARSIQGAIAAMDQGWRGAAGRGASAPGAR